MGEERRHSGKREKDERKRKKREGTRMERIGSEEGSKGQGRRSGTGGTMGWGKAYSMFVTFALFHPETSQLNDEAPENMNLESGTSELFHTHIVGREGAAIEGRVENDASMARKERRWQGLLEVLAEHWSGEGGGGGERGGKRAKAQADHVNKESVLHGRDGGGVPP